MGVKFGHEMKLYFCAAGIGGTPTWTEVPNVRSLKCDPDAVTADASTRAGGGWKSTAVVMHDATVDFDLPWDTSDAALQAFKDAYFGRSVIGVAVMDGPVATVGSEGLWMDAAVTKFQRDESLAEMATVAISLKPGLSANKPQWKEVAA
jgi:hypothetical protein